MRKDSILQNYYYSKLPKAQDGLPVDETTPSNGLDENDPIYNMQQQVFLGSQKSPSTKVVNQSSQQKSTKQVVKKKPVVTKPVEKKETEVRTPVEPYHPLTNPSGYKGKVNLNRIMTEAKKKPAETPYKPSQLVNDVKMGLSAFDAGSSMSSSPFAQGVNFLTRLANSTGDAYTAARYAIDGQWENAATDAGEAILDLFKYAKPKMNYSTPYSKGKLQFTKAGKAQNKLIKGAKITATADDFIHSSIGKFLFGDPDSQLIQNKFGGITKYGPGGLTTDGCRPNFYKNAQGQCVPEYNPNFTMPTNRTDNFGGRSIQETQKQNVIAQEIVNRNIATNKRQFLNKGQATTKESEARRKTLTKQAVFGLPNVRYDEQTGTTSAVNPNMTYEGEPANFMGERQQKSVDHIFGALEAAGYLTGAGELAGAGYNALKAGLTNSMETGLLSKAHNINPWAFKPNSGSYYRGIGKQGLEDAMKTGVFRQAGVESGIPNFQKVWYATGDKGFERASAFSDGLVAEVPKTSFPDASLDFFKNSMGVDTRATSKYIPITEGNILKKDWLQGYKKVPTPKSAITSVENVTLPKITPEQWKDMSGFLGRRQFVKGLQKEGLVGKEFNLGDVNYAARSTGKTDALTKLALDRRHTGFRNVRGELPGGGVGQQEYTNYTFDMNKPGFGQTISEVDNMMKAGVDFTNAQSIAEYQATHIPLEDYGYRSTGEWSVPEYGFLFRNPRPISGKEYGNFQFKSAPNLNFESGNYKDWFKKYYEDLKYHRGDPNFSGGPSRKDNLQDLMFWTKTNEPSVSGATLVGPRGTKAFEIDKSFLFSNMDNLNSEQSQNLKNYIQEYNKQYNTGWRGQYKQGGVTGDPSIPNFHSGDWLMKYGPGGESTDGCGPGSNYDPVTKRCKPNGWIKPFTMPTAASDATSRTFFNPVTKKMVNTATTGQTKENVAAGTKAMGQGLLAETNLKKARVKERQDAKAFNERKTNTFTFPTGETKTLDQMDAREKMYVSGKSLEGKGRINENDEAWYDDYLNPINWVTGMAGALGTAPYEAKQSGSNMPYVSAILNPLLAGRLMGSGSINPLGKQFWTNEVSNKAFLNNMAGGIPGMIKEGARIIPNPYNINPIGAVKDYGYGFLKGGIEQTKGALGELGLLKGTAKRRPFFETFPITKSQKAKVMGMQDEAFADAKKFTDDYWYGDNSRIKPELEEKIREIIPDIKLAKNSDNLDKAVSPFDMTKDQLIPNTFSRKGREGLDEYTIRYLNKNRGYLGGLNDGDISLTLRNNGLYYKTPKEIANIVVHESGHTGQKFGYYGENPNKKRNVIFSFSKTNWNDPITKYDPNYEYFTSNPDTELGLKFQNALVSPKTKKIKLFGPDYTRETWMSSPDELHSELMASKYNLYKKGLSQGLSHEEMMRKVTNPGENELNWLLNNKSINKHFKKTTPLKEKLDLLKLFPAVTPAAIGLGTAAVIANQSNEQPAQQKYGGTSGSILEKYYTSKLNKAEEGIEVGPGPGTPLKPGTLMAAAKEAMMSETPVVPQEASMIEDPVEKTVPVKEYNGISIVDFLTLKGYPADKNFRKHLASEYQIENYDFSAKKNLELLAKLKEDDEILKEVDPEYVPIPVEKLYKKEVTAPVKKNLPQKKKTFNVQDYNARLNLAMMDFRTPAGSRPNLGFLKNSMSWRPAPSAPVVQQPVAQQQGLNPAVLNMMLSTQPSANQKSFVQIPNNPFGSVTGGGGRPPQQTMVTPLTPNVNNGFRAPLQPVDQSFNYPIFTGNQQAAPQQQPVVTPIQQPIMGSFVMPNYQMPRNVSESTTALDNRRQTIMRDAYENNIPITKAPPSLFDYTLKGVEDITEGTKNIIDLGISYIDRKLKLLKGDDEKTITKINLKKPKLEYEGEGVIKNVFEPITLGSEISDEKDIKHRGKGFYHASEMIDLDKFKFGFHNRKGLGSTTDSKTGVTNTEGLIIPVFDKEYEGEEYKDKEGENSIRTYTDSEIKDGKLYGGVDDQGKFYLDFGKNLKGKNLKLADFRYEDVIGFAKDSRGNYILGDETSNKLIAKVPHLITADGKQKPLNVLVPKNGKDQHLTYGETTGGRFILTTPDMKHKFLVSGSLQNLNDSLEEFKKRYNLSTVRVVILDNGTFSRGFRKKDKKIKKNDWKKYDDANDQGGAGFYYYENGGDVSELSEYYSNKLREGGSIKNGTEMTVSTEQLENLKRQGYKIQML